MLDVDALAGRLSFENGTTLRDGRKLLMQTGGSSTSKHPSSLAQGQLMDNRTRRHNMQEAYIKYLAALDETGRMTPPPKIWAEQVAAEVRTCQLPEQNMVQGMH